MTLNLMKNKTVKNATWIIFGRIFQMAINFFVGIWSARYLGPANYGLINYAAAYTAFFMSFCTLGINSVLVNEFVNDSKSYGKIIGTTLFLRAISSFLSAIIIICIVLAVDRNEPTTIIVVILTSIGLIFSVFDTFNFWFQSQLKSKITAIVTLGAYIITSAYKIFLLVSNKSVILFALATSIDYICIAIGLMLVYFKNNGDKLSVSLKYGKELLKKAAPFILPSLMVAIYGQTDKLMLKQMISDAEIGYYSTAVSICNIWCFMLSAVIDSMYPTITKVYNKNQNEFNRLNKILYAIIFYISILVSLGFTVFADFAIKLLYGKAYSGAIAPLRIITWYTAFSYLGVAKNIWVVCKNRQKKLVYIYISSAVVNVILNILLIPQLGAIGAAIASLLAQISTTMIFPFFIKEYRENSLLILDAVLLKGLKK